MLSLMQLLIKLYYQETKQNSGTIQNKTGCDARTIGLSWTHLVQTGLWSPPSYPDPKIYANSAQWLWPFFDKMFSLKKNQISPNLIYILCPNLHGFSFVFCLENLTAPILNKSP